MHDTPTKISIDGSDSCPLNKRFRVQLSILCVPNNLYKEEFTFLRSVPRSRLIFIINVGYSNS